MKKIGKLLNNKYIFWILILIVYLILFFPAFRMKFWWIDDGISLMFSKTIIDSFRNTNFGSLNSILFESNGRLRTIYWLYQTIKYLIGGYNPTIHFTIHFLVLFLTSIFIFEMVRNITKSNLSGFFSGILFVINSLNTENIYRLGPVEPLISFFVTVSLYCLFTKRNSLSIIFLFFVIFTKETGFVLWLSVLFIYILKRIFVKKREISLEKYWLWGFIFTFPLIINFFLRRSGYSTNYLFDYTSILSNLKTYSKLLLKSFPILGLFIFTYLIRLILMIKNGKINKNYMSFINQGMFLSIFIVFLLIQSPWQYVLERYLMPATVGLVIFLGIELHQLVIFISKLNLRLYKILVYCFVIAFICVTVDNTIAVYQWGKKMSFTTNFIQILYSDLAKNTPPNGTVLFNFIEGDSTIELVTETDLHLSLLYNRKDIQVDYLNLDKLPKSFFTIVGTPMIREKYSRNIIEKEIYNLKPEDNLIYKEENQLVITTPLNIIKQLVKKVFLYTIYRSPINGDGIYTYYLLKDYWYKYQILN